MTWLALHRTYCLLFLRCFPQPIRLTLSFEVACGLRLVGIWETPEGAVWWVCTAVRVVNCRLHLTVQVRFQTRHSPSRAYKLLSFPCCLSFHHSFSWVWTSGPLDAAGRQGFTIPRDNENRNFRLSRGIVEVFAVLEYDVAPLDDLSPTFRESAVFNIFKGRNTDEERI